MGADVLELMNEVQAKTISMDFDEQLDAAEEIYGQQMIFHFSKHDVDCILEDAEEYSVEVRERV